MSVSKPTESQAGVLSGRFCQQHRCGNAANPFSPDPTAPPFGEDAQLRLVLRCWCWLKSVCCRHPKRQQIERSRWWRKREKICAKILGTPRFGRPTLRSPTFSGLAKTGLAVSLFSAKRHNPTRRQPWHKNPFRIGPLRGTHESWGRRRDSHPRGAEDNSRTPTNSAFVNATQGCSQTKGGRVDSVECRS